MIPYVDIYVKHVHKRRLTIQTNICVVTEMQHLQFVSNITFAMNILQLILLNVVYNHHT